MPLHLHMPLSIQGACHSPKKGKAEKRREGELLPELTTGWPSESDGAKRSEGGRRKRGWKKTCFYEREGLMLSAIVLRNHTRFATCSVTRARQAELQTGSEAFGFLPVSWHLAPFRSRDWRAGS